MPKTITVEKGDCFINLCEREGFYPETIWQHPENRNLRDRRKNLNIIKKGDQIFFPDKRINKFSKETEKEHIFVLKGTPVHFTLTLLNLGEPRANENYILSIDGDSFRRGRTDQNGTLRAFIPPTARYGLLQLGEDYEEIRINFGYLDPIEEISGVQTRLQNLGFYEGEINDELTDETVAAIAEFQYSIKLSATGELDDETRQKLVEAHGS